MLPTPNKSPHKRDPNAMNTTARILNFKPAPIQSTMPTPRKKTKSRLTLDDEDAVHEDVQIFTDIQDRVPTVDQTEDNPFIGARKTRARTRAQTAPSSSTDVDMDDARADDDKGILYVFRGKKIFRRFLHWFQQQPQAPGRRLCSPPLDTLILQASSSLAFRQQRW
jgi:hypothetical protein